MGQSKHLDWLEVNKTLTVRWSGGTHTIHPGELCRFLKENEDNTLNVTFGMDKGIQSINRQDLDPI